MGQPLSDLATALDFEFPSRGLHSTHSPHFTLPLTLAVGLELVDEEDADIESTLLVASWIPLSP